MPTVTTDALDALEFAFRIVALATILLMLLVWIGILSRSGLRERMFKRRIHFHLSLGPCPYELYAINLGQQLDDLCAQRDAMIAALSGVPGATPIEQIAHLKASIAAAAVQPIPLAQHIQKARKTKA